MERLILDTGVLIALERGLTDAGGVLSDDADVAISSVTAAELLLGVELADATRYEQRRASVAEILDGVEILPFDLDVARHHAALLAHVRRLGRPRGAHDMQIAATARSADRVLITTEKAAFADLPGVVYRVLTPGERFG